MIGMGKSFVFAGPRKIDFETYNEVVLQFT